MFACMCFMHDNFFNHTHTLPFLLFVVSQEGDFEMKHIDRVGASTFNVAIAPFCLSIMGDDGNDII